MNFWENLWRADLSRIELREPLWASPDTPLHRAAQTMRMSGSGCILVCEAGRIAGIFTERDYIKRCLVPRADLEKPVSAFMTSDPVCVALTDSVGAAIRTMFRGGYRRLPVLDAAGRPIGIISVKRIIRYLADCVPSAVYNLPPKPRQVQEAREGA